MDARLKGCETFVSCINRLIDAYNDVTDELPSDVTEEAMCCFIWDIYDDEYKMARREIWRGMVQNGYCSLLPYPRTDKTGEEIALEILESIKAKLG